MPDTRLQAIAARAAGLRARNRALLCALIGALAGLGQAPWGLWPLTVAGLAVLFAILTDSPWLVFGWSSAQYLLYGFAFAVVASLLSGLYPAWKAANDPPVEALRG